MRAGFIGSVLEKLGYITQITSDLIDARFLEKMRSKSRGSSI